MMNAETIEVTILDGGGVCFQNGDELKRLQEAGILRAKAPKTSTIRRAEGGNANSYILERLKLKGVRDLEHYRKIVGNPRTNGLMHRFKSGMTLTMEKCPHPNEPEVFWYVILDTAIGGSVPFIEALQGRGRLQIRLLGGMSGE